MVINTEAHDGGAVLANKTQPTQSVNTDIYKKTTNSSPYQQSSPTPNTVSDDTETQQNDPNDDQSDATVKEQIQGQLDGQGEKEQKTDTQTQGEETPPQEEESTPPTEEETQTLPEENKEEEEKEEEKQEEEKEEEGTEQLEADPDDIEMVKNNPIATVNLINQMHKDLIKLRRAEKDKQFELDIANEQLHSLQKESFSSKYDDAKLPINDEHRPLWMALNRYNQEPNNTAYKKRALNLLQEFAKSIEPDETKTVIEKPKEKQKENIKEDKPIQTTTQTKNIFAKRKPRL